MKKLIVLLIFLPSLFFSQNQPKYPSLLWKISGNGLKKPSYLYGTMHVSNRVAYHLSEEFFAALKSVDVVGLETNPGEWLQNMQNTGELSELSQIRSGGQGGNFYKSAFASALPERRILQGILSYDPDIINGLLYRQNKTRENFEESTYIDLFIYQSAAKLNKEIISLEDFAHAEILARLSALPDEDGANSGDRRNPVYTNAQNIEDAYRDGNLDVLDSLSRLSGTRNSQKYLISDRNIVFASTIDSVIRTRSLFSGVGAAHLPGNDGVIELLRAKGYSVEPVYGKISKRSNAMREKLDKRLKPVRFSRQYASDSLFSVDVPGKLFPVVNIGTLRYDIHADMANGSFYTVVRLKHFAPLYHLSAAQMFARVDSLLFEHIPGKILLKEYISNASGVPGIEVVNRMRRGDEQHYHIYFTDLEMIIFKLGGKGAYASGKDAKAFFSSIRFYPRSGQKIPFVPPAAGFSVSIPGNYSYTRNSAAGASGLMEDLYAYDREKNVSYGVKRAVYNDFNYLEEDTFELVQLARNVLEGFGYRQSPAYTITTASGLPSLNFSGLNNAGAVLAGKVLIKGVHYYLVYQVAAKPDGINKAFFDSFALTDFVHIFPIKRITDRQFYFSANDEVTDNALSRFNESYAKAYESRPQPVKSATAADFDFRSESKYYYSPSTGEYISVTYEKYNDYDYRSKEEIEDRIRQSFRHSTSMMVQRLPTSGKDMSLRYILRDTATSRAIDVRIFFTHGMMHEISVPFDTTLGLRGWVKSFMDSFTPMDTLIGKNIFTNKFGQLLRDLAGEDTVKRRAARSSLQQSVAMQKEYAGDFIRFISGDSVHLVEEDARAQLFVNGGTINDNRIIAPYRKLYRQYTDSFYLQLCLLKGLAYLRTAEGYDAFGELLNAEPPLVGDVNSVADVFSVLHDSLALCGRFFPGMLALARYDEYREQVYGLLARLVHKKLVRADQYAARKKDILADATLALKRFNPAVKPPLQEGSYNLDHLDKAARELAENIIGNLDGLANNNFFRNSKQVSSGEAAAKPQLVNYATILAPFYNSDPQVRDFIAKLLKVRSQEINMPLTITLLRNNIPLHDTVVAYYSSNPITRAYFYSELEKEGLEKHFSDKYRSQKSLIESVLSSQRQLNSLYNNDKGRTDSLVLLTELKAGNKYQKGTIYVYRNVKSRAGEEQWSAVFVNSTGRDLSSSIEIIASSYYIDNTVPESSNLNQLLAHFALSYRKRALGSNETYD